MSAGPLTGIRVIEFASAGGGPFCCMLLADLGADILRIDRPGTAEMLGGEPIQSRFNVMKRGRRSITLDLKAQSGRAVAMRLGDAADVIVEGFRPGVLERLGLGPELLLETNPGLIVGRLTGWGQSGPLAQSAGHDINFVAASGALAAIGTTETVVPPLNLIGDFAGGGLYLALGILAALLERGRSGQGQVVDAAMAEGAASLMTFAYGLAAAGNWPPRGSNLFDGSAPWNTTYRTADGRFIAVGPFEPQFYQRLMRMLGLADDEIPPQHDRSAWPGLHHRLAGIFERRTQDEWTALLAETDACYAPVLPLSEAAEHPQHTARRMFVEVEGVVQPAPVPRFSRTHGEISRPPAAPGQHNQTALLDWGFTQAEVVALAASDAFGPSVATGSAHPQENL